MFREKANHLLFYYTFGSYFFCQYEDANGACTAHLPLDVFKKITCNGKEILVCPVHHCQWAVQERYKHAARV